MYPNTLSTRLPGSQSQSLTTPLTQNPPQNPQSLYPELPPIHPQQIPGDTIPDHNRQGNQAYDPPSRLPSDSRAQSSQEDSLMRAKIETMEGRLDEGWYLAYKVWLGFMYFVGAFGTAYFAAGALDLIGFYGRRALGTCGILVMFLICSLWIIGQAWTERSALANKSLKLARKGLMLMMWFAVFYLATIVTIFWFLHETNRVFVRGLEQSKWIFVAGYVVLVVVNMLGAGKVYGLLKKRDELRTELYARHFYHNSV